KEPPELGFESLALEGTETPTECDEEGLDRCGRGVAGRSEDVGAARSGSRWDSAPGPGQCVARRATKLHDGQATPRTFGRNSRSGGTQFNRPPPRWLTSLA